MENPTTEEDESRKAEERIKHPSSFPQLNPNPVIETERKRTEEALRASEERYRLLVDQSPDAVIVIQDGRFVFSNPAALRLHGAESQDQMIGRLVNDFLHPDDIERVRGAVEALARERSASLNDVRIRCLDGDYTWTEGSGVPVEYDGKPAVQVIIRDITGHKKAEEELRMARLDMERAQEVASVGSWRLDIQKNILTWSDENHRIFGIPKGVPLTYETFLDTVHPDDREYVDTQWKAGLQGNPYDIEHRLLVDGQTSWVREKAYLEFDRTGTLLGGFGITQDITDRKRAEASLHESEERFRHIAETSADIIFQMDPEGRINYCSPAIRSFGYEPGYVLGRTFSEFIPYDELPSAADALQRVNSGESISLFEIRVLKSDSTVVICEVSATPIVKAGKVVGIQGIARDITERRKTAEELQRAHDELEERVQLRTSELSALNDDLEAEVYERRKAENRLARINSLYSILFRVNEAIVRIHNSERLFEQTCRIVVDSGLFKMAWIGLLDPQTAKVEPMASAGDSGKYLNRITIIARDVPEGRGPTGRAIIEGKAIVCPDIEHDPAMAPFREAALKEGFRSSASFPLRRGSTIVGVFNTYADSPRFFTDEEIKLLSSLVEDISFAIEFMDREQKRKEMEEELKASREELRALSAHLQATREEERTKIAREIHDELGQILTAAGMELSMIQKRHKDQPALRKSVSSVIGLLDNAVGDIQRICEELRPRVLDHLGLPAAIEGYAKSFIKRTAINGSVTVRRNFPLLSGEVPVALFRTVQEALTNIARHAKATSFSVYLGKKDDSVLIMVKDNGKGITRTEIMKSSSLGIIGIYERIRSIGGKVDIKGVPGKGTTITITIPG